jgi:ribosomal 50S subunit-recycling heat shock protein
MEYIFVKVAPLGRMVTDIALPKGSPLSDALTSTIGGVFEAADLRINGRRAQPSDEVHNGDIITLIPTQVMMEVAPITRNQIHRMKQRVEHEKTDPPKDTIKTNKVEPVRRSRFECIIE